MPGPGQYVQKAKKRKMRESDGGAFEEMGEALGSSELGATKRKVVMSWRQGRSCGFHCKKH